MRLLLAGSGNHGEERGVHLIILDLLLADSKKATKLHAALLNPFPEHLFRLARPAAMRYKCHRLLAPASLHEVDCGMNDRGRFERPYRGAKDNEIKPGNVKVRWFDIGLLLAASFFAPYQKARQKRVMGTIEDLDEVAVDNGRGDVLGNVTGITGLAVIDDTDFHI